MRRICFVFYAPTERKRPAGLLEWPAHDPASDRHLDLGPVIEAKAGLRRTACDLMDMLYPALWGGAK
jgi:hypothetical protein